MCMSLSLVYIRQKDEFALIMVTTDHNMDSYKTIQELVLFSVTPDDDLEKVETCNITFT
jgi:hypothetical protein